MSELKRRYSAEITLGADDLPLLRTLLVNLLIDLDRLPDNAQGYESVSGGYAGDHSIILRFDPEMTHDRYFELLKQKDTP